VKGHSSDISHFLVTKPHQALLESQKWNSISGQIFKPL